MQCGHGSSSLVWSHMRPDPQPNAISMNFYSNGSLHMNNKNKVTVWSFGVPWSLAFTSISHSHTPLVPQAWCEVNLDRFCFFHQWEWFEVQWSRALSLMCEGALTCLWRRNGFIGATFGKLIPWLDNGWQGFLSWKMSSNSWYVQLPSATFPCQGELSLKDGTTPNIEFSITYDLELQDAIYFYY